MCGIIGVVSNENLSQYVKNGLSLIKHRGPDANNIINYKMRNNIISFGHARLRIIDLDSKADQPMSSIDGNHLIVFNGEIYNFKNIRKELIKKNYRFKTNSDTEVLLNGYIEYGAEILNKLDGIFAFAILDKTKNNIFIARDHLGVKPLYYYFDEKKDYFIFSSEIKAILQFPGIETGLNNKLLGEYLANMWVQEPDTLFENIYKLPSASSILYKNGKITINEYWNPYNLSNSSYSIETLTKESVYSELVSDVPLGLFLSGGLDSSIVGKYMLDKIDKIKSVTSFYTKKDRMYEGYSDDKIYTNKFISYYPDRIDPYYLELSNNLSYLYEELIWYLDEPISDPAIVPAYLLSKHAKERGLTVMLSGMGGDELFGGYPRHNAAMKYNNTILKSNRLINNILSNLLSIIESVNNNGNIRKKMRDGKRLLDYMLRGFPEGYLSMMGHFMKNDIDGLLDNDIWYQDYIGKIHSTIDNYNGELLNKIILYELKGFLSSHNLLYMDKMSMANSIEVRVPLLNKKIVESSFLLNKDNKIHNNEGKIVLKKIAENHFPKEYVYREKAGFGAPIRVWLKEKELRNKIYESFNSREIINILSKRKLDNILNEHYSKNIDHSYQIWTIYTLYLWRKTFKI